MKKIDFKRLLFLFFFFSILLLFHNRTQAQCSTTVPFAASSTWTCPPDVYMITVECWGGGGAGGSATGTASLRGMGGAGAGGAYAKSISIPVVPGTVYTVNVGTGGVSSPTNGVAVPGNDSWFNTTGTIIAKGGAGGVSVVSAGTAGIGAGGAGSLPGSIGETIFVGGSGATSTTTAGSGAGIAPGGGSSAGTAANGNNGALNAGGAAVTGGGAGAAGPTASGASGVGTAGSAPGGGGGGAWAAASTVTRAGGAGGNGKVIVSYTPAPITGTTNVCVNSNTTLSATPVSGEWSSGTPAVGSIDPSSGVVNGISAGTSIMTYIVTVSGCVSSNISTVTVNPLPALTLVDPPAVCSPSTVDITTAAVQTTNTGTTTKYYNSYTLALAGGASNVTAPAAISSSGIYYIRTEFATGCYTVQPVTVTINQSPSFAPLVIQPTCLTNGSISFSALTGGTYTYSYTIDIMNKTFV